MNVADASQTLNVSMWFHEPSGTDDLTSYCPPASSFALYYTKDGGTEDDINNLSSFITVVDSSNYASNIY